VRWFRGALPSEDDLPNDSRVYPANQGTKLFGLRWVGSDAEPGASGGAKVFLPKLGMLGGPTLRLSHLGAIPLHQGLFRDQLPGCHR
jgi:hypothetical protein